MPASKWEQAAGLASARRPIRHSCLAVYHAAVPKRSDELRELAALAQLEADHLRALADLHEKRQRLTGGKRSRTVNSEQAKMLTDAHKVALSASRPGSKTKFLEWIRAKEHGGYSLNRLAVAVAMSPAALSQARRRPSDELFRRITPEKAAQIAALTGWPVEDWP